MNETAETHSVPSQHLKFACSTPFEQLPSDMIVTAFGVDYGHVRPDEGGDLYITRYGWPVLNRLLPTYWYKDKWFAREGMQLPGSGNVYHVATRPVNGKHLDLVVKFSRVAQDVPLVMATTFLDDISPEMIANARFNSPMEEFGLVMELRRNTHGSQQSPILTQRPLAIYAPPEEYKLWELGRSQSRFHAHWRRLIDDQEDAVKAIELDIKRIYVVIYSWIKGEDATQMLNGACISKDDFSQLTPLVIEELRSKGFRVLDNKPNHFILRSLQDGSLLRRHERITYGLVDFELLQRTPEYHTRFKAEQRKRYWWLQSHRFEAMTAKLPSHLRQMNIFGVDYIFGATPDGGYLWVVGRNSELFDYFQPGRWRRTDRLKLSELNEVYYTQTRDNIHVVYRRSRVGEHSHADPFFEQGKRIREHGHNSPYEEIAIAERLRSCGIPTIFPRAVYRTGHPTTRAAHGRDERRFQSHANLLTPTPAREPILVPEYDYYTIWGYFRGINPDIDHYHEGIYGVLDLKDAYETGIIDKSGYEQLLQDTKSRLRNIGLDDTRIDEYEYTVSADREGNLHYNELGNVYVRICIDALTAFEHQLLDEASYRALLQRVEQKLELTGCRELDLKGKHLLLSMDTDGRFRVDDQGEIIAIICNFDCICGMTYESNTHSHVTRNPER
jgi:hypothetical protein